LGFCAKISPPSQSPKNVVPHCKKPTHIQAHLVFADTQSQNEKPKELEFLPTLEIKRVI
jgi:hypothetical protein